MKPGKSKILRPDNSLNKVFFSIYFLIYNLNICKNNNHFLFFPRTPLSCFTSQWRNIGTDNVHFLPTLLSGVKNSHDHRFCAESFLFKSYHIAFIMLRASIWNIGTISVLLRVDVRIILWLLNKYSLVWNRLCILFPLLATFPKKTIQLTQYYTS